MPSLDPKFRFVLKSGDFVRHSGHPPTLSDRRSFDFYISFVFLSPCAALIVGLELSTFKPSDFTSSGDRRDLGIRIYGAALNPVL